MTRALRPYQVEAIDRLYASVAAGRNRPVVMAATGAGKTMIAAEIIERALAKKRRVAFCVPALSLIDQTVNAFNRDGIWDIGVMQAQHPMTDETRPVQVCSIQTIERRKYPTVDLVIVDECHRSAKVVERWMHDPEWQKVPFIGLSATPWAKGMGKNYNDLIVVATTKQLIDEGYLSPFRVFAPSHPDLSDVKVVAGDYQEDQLGTAMDKPELVADIVETWLKTGEGRPTLCYAVNCAHAMHLKERFEAAGVTAAYQDAYTPDSERDIIKRKFHEGEIKVVCNIATLTMGVDWDVRCIILARPTHSSMLFVQIIGRALRKADGKTDALILDHSDNHLRLGFVTDIHYDKLDNGEKKKVVPSVPLPKECPKCAYLRPRKEKVCPNCGYKPEGPKKWEKENASGELVEMATATKIRKKNERVGIRLKAQQFDAMQFYAELKGYAEIHGYKPGWISFKYKEMMGFWPPASYRELKWAPPSGPVISWIKSRQIAWAKRKRRDEHFGQDQGSMALDPPRPGS